MTSISKKDTGFECISRFQSLQAGQYWRAVGTIPEEGIDSGTVLLIQSIRWVDDAAHTIILRPHPSKIGMQVTLQIPDEDGTVRDKWFRYQEHRFLLKDFLDQFEYEPDHQKVRSEEVRGVQGQINTLQAELLEAQGNPALLAQVVEEELAKQESDDGEGSTATPSPPGTGLTAGKIADVIAGGITTETVAALRRVAGREHQIATIKSKWIQGKTTAIAETIKALTPYYEEQAAAALAQTEDVRTYVEKIMEGIESLDLYVGKDVDVTTIREGIPAPSTEPLTFVQKKLLMDEELAVWANVDERFDYSSEGAFFEALREHDSLVNQIFPAERCVLVMASTRRYIDYGDKWTNAVNNRENKKVFLLVRNGMNIHRVFSPVESHLGSARLFPSQDEQDRVFRGMDGGQITFEDVAYTDKLSDHDRFALHYKRFLLLACGLDHRLKLFGDFYEGEPSLNFVSQDFQDQHCRFLHDDTTSGRTLGERRTPLDEWIKEKNAYLRSGSRVMCNWFELMNPDTAPAACKSDVYWEKFDRRYTPKNSTEVVIAKREGKSFIVTAEVSGETLDYETRTFNCKVNLSKLDASCWTYNDLPYLCLDAVEPEELDWYIHNRETRKDHLSYIRAFKRALKYLREELASQVDTRQRLAKALEDGGIATGEEARAIIQQTVIAWRATNRGKPLPQFENGEAPVAWKSLLDQMFMLAGQGKKQVEGVEDYLQSLGLSPLRLVLTGGAKLAVYAAPCEDDLDNRIDPHVWVHRITLESGKTRFIEKSRCWANLPKALASETTLHQWPEAEDWAGKESVFPSYERKQEVFAAIDGYRGRLQTLSTPMDADAFAGEFSQWDSLRRQLLRGGRYVHEPAIAVPIGLVYYSRSKELCYLCVAANRPHGLLARLAPDEEACNRLRETFVRVYADKEGARETFHSDEENPYPWSIIETSISLKDVHQHNYFHSQLGVSESRASGQSSDQPLFAHWYPKWTKEAERCNARFWFADGVVSDDGDLILDSILGNHLPDDYAPVNVISVDVIEGFEDRNSKPCKGWYDICPVGTDFSSLKPDGYFHLSYSTHTALSPADAIAYIERMAASHGHTLLKTTEAPEGVERWVISEQDNA